MGTDKSLNLCLNLSDFYEPGESGCVIPIFLTNYICKIADFASGQATNFCKVAEIPFGRQYYKNLVLTFCLGGHITNVILLTLRLDRHQIFVKSRKFRLNGNITKIWCSLFCLGEHIGSTRGFHVHISASSPYNLKKQFPGRIIHPFGFRSWGYVVINIWSSTGNKAINNNIRAVCFFRIINKIPAIFGNFFFKIN